MDTQYVFITSWYIRATKVCLIQKGHCMLHKFQPMCDRSNNSKVVSYDSLHAFSNNCSYSYP